MWLMYPEDILALEAEYRFWARCQTVDCAALRAGPYARFRRRLVGYLHQETWADVKAGEMLRVGPCGTFVVVGAYAEGILQVVVMNTDEY
jgi:hypothetical protein